METLIISAHSLHAFAMDFIQVRTLLESAGQEQGECVMTAM